MLPESMTSGRAAAGPRVTTRRGGAGAGRERLAQVVDRRRGGRARRRNRMDGCGPPRRRQVRASDASAVGDVVPRCRRGPIPLTRRKLRRVFVVGPCSRRPLVHLGQGRRRRKPATDYRRDRRVEKYPAWSPDGRYIAFSRMVNGRSNVLMVSALGGRERQIAEGQDPTWLPDSRSLVMMGCTPDCHCGLVHQVLETGAHRQLTQAPNGFIDHHPRVSPDGSTLAFERSGSGRSGLFVMPMSGGAATQIGDWSSGFMAGLAWTPDGGEILFARPEMSGRRLFRVAAGGREPAMAISGVPLGSISPSVSHLRGAQDYRLAFVSGQPDVGLRMIDLQAPLQGTTITVETPFCDATRMDTPGRFSPDGTQVAFSSDRSGSQQVWIAGRDGSALRSVTDLQDATVNVGSWSPDGQLVAFDATMSGNRDIYVVRSDGGPLKRLTHDTGAESDPEWSRDGRWIYYSSNASGRSEIWKMHADGGGPVKLTSEGGFEPRESPDGQSVYFIDRERGYGLGPAGTLKRIPATGGAASVVKSGINAGAWESTDTGIVFLMGLVRPPGRSTGAGYAGRARRRRTPAVRPARGTRVSCGPLRNPPIPHCLARWAMGARRPHRWMGARHLRRRRVSVARRDYRALPPNT